MKQNYITSISVIVTFTLFLTSLAPASAVDISSSLEERTNKEHRGSSLVLSPPAPQSPAKSGGALR